MNMTLFVLRRLVTRIFFPVAVFSGCLICCCVLLFHRKTEERALRILRIFLPVLTGVLLLVGYTGSFWLKLWTRQYLPLDISDLSPDGHFVIAVPGHEYIPDPRFPLHRRFSAPMLLRLEEAAGIARAMDRCGMDYEIAVSTFVESGRIGEVFQALEKFFEQADAAVPRLSLLHDAVNSRGEVRHFARMPGRLILVSNAFHVPRLMILARKYGAEAVPAPADAMNYTGGPRLFTSPWPNSRNIHDFERLCYELLGCAEAKIF